tara:strand:+ start:9394 stop:33303 length:23910 start_codon:yes stop_codon:yes gene_type:complete
MFRFPTFEDDDLGPDFGGGFPGEEPHGPPTLPTSPPSGEGYAGGGVMLASAHEGKAGFNWETCYVNIYSDLKSALPSWMPSILHHYSNGYSQRYYSSSLAAAGRHHYILYGYSEGRVPNCPVVDKTGPSLSSPSASMSPSTIGSGSSSTLTASITASDSAGISSVTANGQQMVNSSGNTWVTTFNYPWSSSYASTTRTLSVTFVARDSLSNTSSASASTSLTYQAVPDTTSPSVGTPSASPSSLSFSDSSSSSQSVTISATVTDNASSASSLSVYFNGSTGSRSGSTFSRTFSVSKPSSLGTSYFSCSIYARDAAGNQSTTKSISVPIYRTDNTKPSITFNNPGNKTFSLNGSSSLRVYYTVSASDSSPSSGISSVTIGGATQYSSSSGNYYFYEDFSRSNYGFSSTPVTRTATATDGAGNSRSASQTFNISINDDVKPILGTLNHSGTVSIYTSGGTGSSNTARQYYNITATDEGRGLSSTPTISGATYWYNSGNTYFYYEDFAYPNYGFTNTSVTRTATVTDLNGNSASKSASFSVRRVDNSNPSITFYNPGTQEFTTNGSSTLQVSYRVNVSDVGQGVSTVSIPGASRTSGSGSGNWYFKETFSKSSYNYSNSSVTRTATVTDGAGRSKSASVSFNIKIRDDAAPVLGNLVISSNPVLINTNPGTHTDVTYSITASDQGLGLSGNPTINGNASYSSSSGGTYYFTERFQYSDYGFTNSALSRTVTFTDGVNSSTKSVSFNVRRNDNQAPTLGTLVGPTTVLIKTSGPGYTDVLFSVTAVDVGRGLSVVEPSIDGDAEFDSTLGTSYNFTERFRAEDYSFTGTPVTRTVTFQDEAGNPTTASRSFTVIRDDDNFPSLTALVVSPNPVNIPISAGSKVVTYSLFASDVGLGLSGNPTINGNAAYTAGTSSPYRFTETFNASDYGFSNSSRTRTVTFTDGAGNQSTKSVTFNVKKVDDVKPTVGTLTISPNPVIINIGGSNSTLATYSVVASDSGQGLSGIEINGNAEYVLGTTSPHQFTENFRFADYGFTNTNLSRTVKFTDSAGNFTEKTVSFSVRNKDNVAPTITSFTRFPSAFTLSPTNTSQIVTFTLEVNDFVNGNTNTSIGFNDDDVAVVGATFFDRIGNTWYFRKTYSFAGRSFGTVSDTYRTDVQDADGNQVAQNQTTTVTISTVDNQPPTNLAIFTNYDGGFFIDEQKTDEPDGGLLIYVNATDVHSSINDNGVTVTGAITGASGNKSITPVFEDRTAETWTFRHKFASADYNYGAHFLTLTATVTDTAGQTASIPSSVIGFNRRDNVNPVIVAFSANKTSISLNQNTPSDSVTYSVTASDIGSGISNVYIEDVATGTNISGNISTLSSSPFTFTETFNKLNFSYDSHSRTRRAVVQDSTSTVFSPNTVTVNITRADVAAPIISNVQVSPSSATINSSDPNKSRNFTITATITDADSGVSSAVFEGNQVTSNSSTFSYSKTVNFSSLSNWGNNSFSVPIVAYDNQDNLSGISYANFTVTKVDNTAPVIQEITASPASVTLSSSGPTSVTVTFTALVTDIGRGVNENTLSLTSNQSIAPSYKTKPSSGVYTFEKIYDFSDFGFGTATDILTLNVSDEAGLPAGSDTVSVTVTKEDDVPPTISGFSVNTNSVNLSTEAPNTTKTVTFTVQATDDIGIASVSVTGATQTTFTSPFKFTKTYNISNYNSLAYGGSTTDTVFATVVDTQGNSVTFPNSITINISKTDDTPPTIQSGLTVGGADQLPNGKYEINLDGNTGSTSKIVLFTVTGVADLHSGIAPGGVVLTSNNTAANAKLVPFLFPDPPGDLPGEPGGIDQIGRDDDLNPPGTYRWRMVFDYGDYAFNQQDITFTLTVTDNASNTLTRTAVFDINKTDAVKPTISSVVIRDGATNSVISSNNISLLTSNGETHQKSVKFIITASDNIGLDRIELDGANNGVRSGNTWTFTRTYKYSDYSFGTTAANLSAIAYDSQSNASTPATTIPFSVIKTDDFAPVMGPLSITHNGTAINSNNRLVLKSSEGNKEVTLSFTITEKGQGLDSPGFVSVSNGWGTPTISGPDGNGLSTFTYTKNYSYSSVGGIGNRSDTILIDVRDKAGNNGTPSTAAVFFNLVDDSAPQVSTFTASATNLVWNSNDPDNSNPGTKPVTFTATGVSDNQGIASIRVKYDTGLTSYQDMVEVPGQPGTYRTTVNYSRPGSINTSVSFAAALEISDGTNVNATKSVTLTRRYLDNSPPVISNKRITDTNGNTITQITLTPGTPTVTVVYKATVTDNDGISNVSFVDNGNNVSPTSNPGTNPREVTLQRQYSLASYNYQVGQLDDRNISISATDDTNNSVLNSLFTPLLINVIDNVDPVFTTFTQKIDGVETSAMQTLTTASTSFEVIWQIKGVTDVGSGIKSVILTSSDNLDGQPQPFNNTNSLSTGIWNFKKTYTYNNQTFAATKTDTITLAIKDNENNDATGSMTKIVNYRKIDHQAPVISIVADKTTVTVDDDNQTRNVNFTINMSDNISVTSVTFSGDKQGPLTVTPSPLAFGVLPFSSRQFTGQRQYHYTQSSWLSFLNTNEETFTFTASDGTFTTTETITIEVVKDDIVPPTIGSSGYVGFPTVVTPINKTITLDHQTPTADVVFRVIASDNESGINKNATSISSHIGKGTLQSVVGPTTIFIPTPGGPGDPVGPGEIIDFEVEPEPGIQYTIATQYTITKQYRFNEVSFGTTQSKETITFFDNAGNQASTSSIAINIVKFDTENPTLSNPSINKTSISLYSEVDGIQKTSEAVKFSVEATDQASGIASVKFNNPTLGDIVLTRKGSTDEYEATKTFNFSGGTPNLSLTGFNPINYVWTASCIDGAGNETTLTTQPVTLTITRVDNTDPIISNYTSFGDDNGNVVLNDTSNQSAVVLFSATVTDGHRGISLVKFNYTGGPSGGQVVTPLLGAGNVYSFTRTYTTSFTGYGDGNSKEETVTITAIDNAGNISSQAITITVIKNDTAKPVIVNFQAIINYGLLNEEIIYNNGLPGTGPNAGTVFLGTNDDNTDGYPKTRVVTYKAIATDNVGIVDIENSLKRIVYKNQVVGSPTTIAYSEVLSDKSNNIYIWQTTFDQVNYTFADSGQTDQFRLRINDAANTAGSSYVQSTIPLIVVKRDETSPSIASITSNLTNNEVILNNKNGNDDGKPEQKEVIITVTASDNHQIRSVTCLSSLALLGNVSYQEITPQQEANIFKFRATYTYDNMPSFGDNSDIVTVRVEDQGANNTTRNFTIQTIGLNIIKEDANTPSITVTGVRDHLAGTDGPETRNFKLFEQNNTTRTIRYYFDVSEDNALTGLSVTGATKISGPSTNSGNGGSYVYERTWRVTDIPTYGDNDYQVNIVASDAAGATTSIIQQKVAKIDNVSPTVTSIIARDTDGNIITNNEINLLPANSPKTVVFEVHAYDNRDITSVDWDGGTGNSSNVSVAAMALPPYNRNYQNPSQPNYIAQRPGEKVYYYEKTYRFEDYTLNTTTNNLISVVVTDPENPSTIGSGDEPANSTQKLLNFVITTNDTDLPVISDLKANLKAGAPLISITSIDVKTSQPSKTIQFRATITDNVAVGTVTARDKNNNLLTVSSSGNQYLCEKTYNYTDGILAFDTPYNEKITWTAQDTTGNQSNPNTGVFNFIVRKVDDEKPNIVSYVARESADPNSALITSNTISLTTDSKLKDVFFHINATDNRAVSLVGLVSDLGANYGGNPTELPNIATPNYIFKKTYDYNDFTYGDHTEANHIDTLTLRVQDAAGNFRTQTLDIKINKTDNEDPQFSSNIEVVSFTNLTENADNKLGDEPKIKLTSSEHFQQASPVLTFRIKVKDNVGIKSLTIGGANDGFTPSVGNPTLPNTTSSDLTFEFTKTFNFADFDFTRNIPVSQRPQTRTYEATLIDIANNEVKKSITIEIDKVDDTPPTITTFEIRRNDNATLISDLNNTGTVTLKSSSKTLPIKIKIVPQDDIDIASVVIDGASQSGTNHPTQENPELDADSTFTVEFTKTLNYDDYDYGTNNSEVITCTVTNSHGLSVQKNVSVKIHKQDDLPPVLSLTANPSEISVHSEEDGANKTEQTVIFTAVISDNVTTYNNLSISLATASLIQRTPEDEANNRVRFQKTYKYSDALLSGTVPNNAYTDTLLAQLFDGGHYGNDSPPNGNRTDKTVDVKINKVDNTDPSITELLINNSARANDEFSIDLKSEGNDNTKLVTFHVTTNDAQTSIKQVSVTNSGVGGVVTALTRTNDDIAQGRYRFSKTYSYGNYKPQGFGNNVAQDEVTFQVEDNATIPNTANKVATIKINREDITIPNPPTFTPASGTQTVTISTNNPTTTIDINVTATDDDSGVNRVVMHRPAVANRGIVNKTVHANSATNDVYSFTGIEYNFSDYNTVSGSQNITENILFTITDNNGKTTDENYSVSIVRIENEAPDVTITTQINGVDVGEEDRIINLSNTNVNDLITFVINATDNNGISTVSMAGTQFVNQNEAKTVTRFSKTITYNPNPNSSRFTARGETISFIASVTDTYGNLGTDEVEFIVKQINDRAPHITDISLSNSTLTLNDTNLTSGSVRVTVLATDVDFPGVTLPSLAHVLTTQTTLPEGRIEKVVEEYGIYDNTSNAYKFVWEITYERGDFSHFSNIDSGVDLTEKITARITDGDQTQTADVNLTIIRNDTADPVIKNATRLQQLQPAYKASVADDTTFTITASDPVATHTLRFNLDAKVIDNGSGLSSVTAKFFQKDDEDNAIALAKSQNATNGFTHTFPIEINIDDKVNGQNFNMDWGHATTAATEYRIKLTAIDNASNLSTFVKPIKILKVDDVNPVISNQQATPATATVRTNNPQDTLITISFDCIDLQSGLGPISVTKPDGTQLTPHPNNAISNLKQFTRTIAYNELTTFGDNTFSHFINVTDLVGRTVTVEVTNTISKQDGSGPVIPNVNASDSAISLHTKADGTLITSKQVTFTFGTVGNPITDNKMIQSVEFKRGDTVINTVTKNPGLPSQSTVVTCTDTISASDSDISVGSTILTYSLTATDSDGNVSDAKTTDVVVNLTDNTQPTIVSFSLPNGEDDTFKLYSTEAPNQNEPISKELTFTTTAKDNVGIQSVSLSLITKNGSGFAGQQFVNGQDQFQIGEPLTQPTSTDGDNQIFVFNSTSINYASLGDPTDDQIIPVGATSVYATHVWRYQTRVVDVHGNVSLMTKDINIDKMDDRKPSVSITFVNESNVALDPQPSPTGNQYVIDNGNNQPNTDYNDIEFKVYCRVSITDAEGANDFTVTAKNFRYAAENEVAVPSSDITKISNTEYIVLFRYKLLDTEILKLPFGATSASVEINVQQNSENYRTQISTVKNFTIPLLKKDTLAPGIYGFYPNKGANSGTPIDIAATDGAVEEVILNVIIFDRFGDKIGHPHSLDIFGVVGNGDSNKIEITSSKLGVVTRAELESTAKMQLISHMGDSDTLNSEHNAGKTYSIKLKYNENLFANGANTDTLTIKVADTAGNVSEIDENGTFKKINSVINASEGRVVLGDRGNNNTKIHFNKIDSAGPTISNVVKTPTSLSLLENEPNTVKTFTISANISDRSGILTGGFPKMVFGGSGYTISSLTGPEQNGDNFTWTCGVKYGDVAGVNGSLRNGFGNLNIPFTISALDTVTPQPNLTQVSVNMPVEKRDTTAPSFTNMKFTNASNSHQNRGSGRISDTELQMATGPQTTAEIFFQATIVENGVGILGSDATSISPYVQLSKFCPINNPSEDDNGFKFDIVGSKINNYDSSSKTATWAMTFRYSDMPFDTLGYGIHPFRFKLTAVDRHNNVGEETFDFTINITEINAPTINGFVAEFKDNSETNAAFKSVPGNTIQLDNDNVSDEIEMRMSVNVSEDAAGSGVKSVQLRIKEGAANTSEFGLPSSLTRTPNVAPGSNKNNTFTYNVAQTGNVNYTFTFGNKLLTNDFTNFGQYSTTYEIVATDNVGNVSTQEKTITVNYLDNLDPVITDIKFYQETNNGFELINGNPSVELGFDKANDPELFIVVLANDGNNGSGIDTISLTTNNSQTATGAVSSFNSALHQNRQLPGDTGKNTFRINIAELDINNNANALQLGSNTVQFTATATDVAGNNVNKVENITVTVKETEAPEVASFRMLKLNDAGNALEQIVDDRDVATIEESDPTLKRIIEVTLRAVNVPLSNFQGENPTHQLNATAKVGVEGSNHFTTLTKIINKEQLNTYLGLNADTLSIPGDGNVRDIGGKAGRTFYFEKPYNFDALFASFGTLGQHDQKIVTNFEIAGNLVLNTPITGERSNGFQFTLSDTTAPDIKHIKVYNSDQNTNEDAVNLTAQESSRTVNLQSSADNITKIIVLTVEDASTISALYNNRMMQVQLGAELDLIDRTANDIKHNRFRFSRIYKFEGDGAWPFFGTRTDRIDAMIKDAANNQSTLRLLPEITVTKVDSVAPELTSVTFNPASGTKNVYTEPNGSNNTTETITATVNASDAHSGLDKFYVDGVAYNFADGNTFTFVINQAEAGTFGEAAVNGPNKRTFEIYVKDKYGLQSASRPFEYFYGKLDNTAPVITGIQILEGNTKTISNNSKTTTFKYELTVTDNSKANADAHNGIQKVFMTSPLDGQAVEMTIESSGNGKIVVHKSYNYDNLPSHIATNIWNAGSSGSHTIVSKFTVRDETGNDSAALQAPNATLNITDTIAPSISVSVSPAEHTISLAEPNKTFDFTISVNDNETGIDMGQFTANKFSDLTKKDPQPTPSITVYVDFVAMNGENSYNYYTDGHNGSVPFSGIIYTGNSYKFIYNRNVHPWTISNNGYKNHVPNGNLNITFSNTNKSHLSGITGGEHITLSFNSDNGNVGGQGFISWYCTSHASMIGGWPVRSGTNTIVYQKTYNFANLFKNSEDNNHHGDYEFDTVRNLFNAAGHTREFDFEVEDRKGNSTTAQSTIKLTVLDSEEPTVNFIKFYDVHEITNGATDDDFTAKAGQTVLTGRGLLNSGSEVATGLGGNPEIEVRDGEKRRVLILVQVTDGAKGSGINIGQTTLNIAHDGGAPTLTVANNTLGNPDTFLDNNGVETSIITFKHVFNTGQYDHQGSSENFITTATIKDNATTPNSKLLHQNINVNITEIIPPEIIAWEVNHPAGPPSQNGIIDNTVRPNAVEYDSHVHHNYESTATQTFDPTGDGFVLRGWIRDEGGSGINQNSIKIVNTTNNEEITIDNINTNVITNATASGPTGYGVLGPHIFISCLVDNFTGFPLAPDDVQENSQSVTDFRLEVSDNAGNKSTLTLEQALTQGKKSKPNNPLYDPNDGSSGPERWNEYFGGALTISRNDGNPSIISRVDLYLADPNTGEAAMVKTGGKYRINLFSSDDLQNGGNNDGVTVFVEAVITDTGNIASKGVRESLGANSLADYEIVRITGNKYVFKKKYLFSSQEADLVPLGTVRDFTVTAFSQDDRQVQLDTETTFDVTLSIGKFDDFNPNILSFTSNMNQNIINWEDDNGGSVNKQTLELTLVTKDDQTTNPDLLTITLKETDSQFNERTLTMVKGATNADGFTTYTYQEEFNKVDFLSNEVKVYEVTVKDQASSNINNQSNSATQSLSVNFVIINIVSLGGGLTVDGNLLDSTLTDSLFLLEETKTRTKRAPGNSNMPDFYIKVEMDLNSYVTRGQTNQGGITAADDTFGLKLPTISHTSNYLASNTAYKLPYSNNSTAIPMGKYSVNSGAGTTLNGDGFDVLITFENPDPDHTDENGTPNNYTTQNLLKSEFSVTTSNSTSNTQISAVVDDDVTTAQYLYYHDEANGNGVHDGDATSLGYDRIGDSNAPSLSWLNEGVEDNLEDVLTARLTVQDILDHYGSELQELNNAFNNSIPIPTWSISFDNVLNNGEKLDLNPTKNTRTTDEQAFDQFCRFRLNGQSPDTPKIFVDGDAFVTRGNKQVTIKVSDINNQEHTIMDGPVFGLIVQKYDADGENTVIKKSNTPVN